MTEEAKLWKREKEYAKNLVKRNNRDVYEESKATTYFWKQRPMSAVMKKQYDWALQQTVVESLWKMIEDVDREINFDY